MFLTQLITEIRHTDMVLEIGPGASPHPTSNSFMELSIDSDQARVAQRCGGFGDADFKARQVHGYRGGGCSVSGNHFDRVIDSHVLEHVEDPASFLDDVVRVDGGSGYLKYPLIS